VADNGRSLASHLLRTCVLRRHQSKRCGRRVKSGRSNLRVKNLSNAEVQKLRRAVVRDQNVRGLEVAVNDKILVRVSYGRADFSKKFQTLYYGERLRVAVVMYLLAFHILHDEVRQTVFRCASVKKTRDVGMIQRGQNLSFVAEAAHYEIRIHAALYQLDCDALLKLVIGAHGQKD